MKIVLTAVFAAGMLAGAIGHALLAGHAADDLDDDEQFADDLDDDDLEDDDLDDDDLDDQAAPAAGWWTA